MTVDCVVPGQAILGECPVWSKAEQRLYWVDIDGRTIHRFDPATGIDDTQKTAGRPGSFALTHSPGVLLLAMEHEVGWYDWSQATYTPWLPLETARTGNRLNDGRCDRAGRYWVGSMWESAADNRYTGMLHRLDPTGATHTARREVGVANGLAFSPDGTTMYFADTLHDTIWAYDYDADTGEPSRERVFSDFSGLPGRPDGACVDEDGCYWIACVHGGAVARLTPHGAIDRVVEVPADRPTMPAFGGPDLGTLYVTSIGRGGSRSATSLKPADGGLLAIDAGVAGLVDTPFAGSPATRVENHT